MKNTRTQTTNTSHDDSPNLHDSPQKPINKWKHRYTLIVGIAIVLVGLVGAITLNTINRTSAANPTPVGLWGNTTPSNTSATDDQATELGMRFTANTNGSIYGIRFYKGNGNNGTHTGSLWNTSGQRLATSTFTNESKSGWQQMNFSQPVAVKANTTYIASYFAPSAHYAYTYNFFNKSHTVGALTATQGLYKYGGGFPTKTYLASNYWVDVLFIPQSSTQPTSVPTQAPTQTATSQPKTPTPQPTIQVPTPTPTVIATPPTNPGTCSNFSACGFPDASNTGVPSGTTLKAQSGNISITDNNTVISGVDLTGSFDVYANNVTIENSRISSSNWWGINLRSGYSGLKILHCTIVGVVGKGPDNGGEDYGVSNMGNGSIEVGYNNISAFSDVISMGHGYIHDNYVHDLQAFRNMSNQMNHADPFISDGADPLGLTITHNTLLNQLTADQGASAAIGLFADDGPVTNATITNNWIAGGAYALYGGGQGSTNIKVTNNVFSTEYWPQCGIYGPVAYWNASGSGNIFSGNTFSNGKPVSPQS
ncbi:DUF4082 domain-containing protein [Ktedonospora formicarum]|uniref:DUF4082 domain-containing protein n=1 Tax=Ktedonospora formicarum TaxID=2778364 RepID=A0A8J3I5Y4_9CHLR|nr:DUF4082 domain-containing protein [Ktedonospora formicarum]GHO45994.1 hypothetical protein KSX_41570 [Ktedonospora formicarum]